MRKSLTTFDMSPTTGACEVLLVSHVPNGNKRDLSFGSHVLVVGFITWHCGWRGSGAKFVDPHFPLTYVFM